MCPRPQIHPRRRSQARVIERSRLPKQRVSMFTAAYIEEEEVRPLHPFAHAPRSLAVWCVPPAWHVIPHILFRLLSTVLAWQPFLQEEGPGYQEQEEDDYYRRGRDDEEVRGGWLAGC